MPTYEGPDGRRLTIGWDASDDELDILFNSGGPVTGPSRFISNTIPSFAPPVKAPKTNIPTQDFKSNPGTIGKAWNWANSPLIEAPARWGKTASNWLTEPELDDSKATAMAKGFAGGALEGLGGVVSGLTSPLSVASLGGRGLASTGLKGYATAANAFDKIGGAGMMLEGGGEVLDPSTSWGEKALGLARAAGGATSFIPSPKPKMEILPPEAPVPAGARVLGESPVKGYLPEPKPVEPPIWYQGGAGVVRGGQTYPVDVGTTNPLIQGRRTTPTLRTPMETAQNMGPNEIASTADTLRAGEVVQMPADYVAEFGQRLGIQADVPTARVQTPLPDFYKQVNAIDPRLPKHYQPDIMPEHSVGADAVNIKSAPEVPRPNREPPSPELLAPVQAPVRKPRGEPTPGSGVYSKQNIAFDRYRVQNPNAALGSAAVKITVGTVDDAFEKFKNYRRAAQYEGAVVQDKLKAYKTGDPNVDMQQVMAVQAGKAPADVKQYFADALTRARKAGIQLNELPDYIPQLWNNTEEEIAQVFGPMTKRAKQTPDFAYERVIESYKKGIEKGLTPKYNNIADLAGWYETQLQTVMANREFVNYLKKTGNLVPSKNGQVLPGWQTIRPEIMGTLTKNIAWQAPKKVARQIENYMAPNEGPLAVAAGAVRKSKEVMLSGGIPGTAINAHGLVNIPNRVLDMTRSPAETAKTLGMAVNVKKADKFLKDNVREIPRFVQAGMSAGAEGFWASVSKTPTFSELLKDRKIGAIWDKLVSEPTFQKYLPAVQLQQAMRLEKKFIASGMAPEEATKAAARTVNDFFSGKTFDEQSVKNLADILLLAPAWQSTSWKIAKGAAAKSGAEGNVYKGAIGTMIAKRLAADFARQFLTGQGPSSAARSGNIPIGTDSRGLQAEIDPMGASDRPVALPSNIASNIINGVPIGNTIDSTLRGFLSGPAGLAYSAIKNRDWRGRPMHSESGRPVPTNEAIGNYVGGLAGIASPGPVRAGFDWARGMSSPAEAAAQAMELPIRWYGKRPADVKSPFSDLFSQ